MSGEHRAASDGPLTGIRILDLTTIILGPFASQILGDMGADVIKVEPPEGDAVRSVGPPPGDRRASVFLGSNRNKRSLVLDLKQPRGREALLRLAAGAQVFMHNMRPRAIERLGLGYETLRAANPGIVFCGAYGFRRAGPYSDKPAYDDMIQAASGLAALQGAGNAPRYVTSSLCDKVTAQSMAHAITLALFHHARSGEGQAVEVTMFETMTAFNMVEHLYGQTYVPARTPVGYTRTLSKYRRPYRTLDGYIGVLPYSDEQWRAVFEVAGRPELVHDPRFADLESRHANINTLYELLGGLLTTRTTAQWLDDLDADNVPAMAVLTGDDLIEDEHLKAVDFWQLREDPELGTLRMPGMTMQFSATPGGIRRLPPKLGEHSAQVLGEVGYSAAEIAEMAASGITSGATQ